jgi:hypothetical protein
MGEAIRVVPTLAKNARMGTLGRDDVQKKRRCASRLESASVMSCVEVASVYSSSSETVG